MLRFTLVSNHSSRKTVPLFCFLYVCVDEELRWSNFDSIYSISSTCDWSFYWGNWHFFKIVGNICWPLTMENSWIDNEMDLSLIQTWTIEFNQIKTVVSFFEYKFKLMPQKEVVQNDVQLNRNFSLQILIHYNTISDIF